MEKYPSNNPPALLWWGIKQTLTFTLKNILFIIKMRIGLIIRTGAFIIVLSPIFIIVNELFEFALFLPSFRY